MRSQSDIRFYQALRENFSHMTPDSTIPVQPLQCQWGISFRISPRAMIIPLRIRSLKIDGDLLSTPGKGRLQRALYSFQLYGAINSFNNLDHFSALDSQEQAILLLTKFSSYRIKELASIRDYFRRRLGEV